MKEQFISLMEELGLTVTEQQWDKFNKYYDLLIQWNDKLNLTSITDRTDVFIKHFYDSVCLVKAMPMNHQTILDVGSGAGFPSIPLKIMFPDIQITILDALQKRIVFLQELVQTLDINVELIHGRAEEFSNKNTYDIVTARAVANLQVLSELCIPFVRVDGYFLAMKGPSYEEEVNRASRAITTLGATVEDVIAYMAMDYQRAIVTIKKIEPTGKKYPRKYKRIKTNPL